MIFKMLKPFRSRAGCFETELYLRSGGNYVMIDFTDFVGTVEMTCEYLNE